MYKALGHMAVRVSDIEKSLRFYQDVLGLKEAFRINQPDGSPSIVYLSVIPGQFVELFPNGRVSPARGDDEIGFTHVCLEVDDAQAACALLRQRGALIDREVATGRSGAKQFWTHDPDGNAIEIMELSPGSMQAEAIRRMLSDIG